MSANAYQRESGRWCVRWKWRGSSGRITCDDEQEAESLADEIRGAHKAGHNEPVRRHRACHPAEGPPSLNVVIADYLESLERRGRAPSTIYAMRNMLATLLQYLRTIRPRGRLVPELLSESCIEGYVDWNRGRDLRESTVYRYTATVEAFWAWAHQRDRWATWVPAPRSAELPPPVPEEIRALTWPQIDRAIALCSDIPRLNPWIAPGLIVARFSGLRLGQMWRLIWEDVVGLGTDAPELVIRPPLGKSRREKIGRRIPLSQPFADWLRERRQPTGYIVAPEMRREWKTGDRLALPSGRPLHRVWMKAGIDPELVARRPFHIIRKAFETEMTRRRATGLAVDFLLGHAPRGVGSSIYLDLGWGLRDQVLEAVALIPAIGAADDLSRARARKGRG